MPRHRAWRQREIIKASSTSSAMPARKPKQCRTSCQYCQQGADSMGLTPSQRRRSDREGQNAVEQAAFRIEAVKATLQGELQRMAMFAAGSVSVSQQLRSS